MSDFRSFLSKKHNRVITIVTVCTLATGALFLSEEKQQITKVTITAEAKENTIYQSANIESPSYQLLLEDTTESAVVKGVDLVSKYSTGKETMVRAILAQTKAQVQDVIETNRQAIETNLKEAAKAQKEAKKIKLTKKEINVLERIVEAEAGDQDVMGRMLVANVVLNRVNDKEFPDNVKDVVFQHKGSLYQFSPAKSGSVHRVTVSETTKKAVKRVLNGEDESQGALYFVQRNIANKKSLSWFDRDLTRLFKHGCHTFYK